MSRITIPAPLRPLRASELPNVECSKAEAKSWFSGWWHGIAIGFVIGLGAAVVVLR